MNKLAKQLYRLAFNIYAFKINQNLFQGINKFCKDNSIQFESWLEEQKLSLEEFKKLLNSVDPLPQGSNLKLALFAAKAWIKGEVDLKEDSQIIKEDLGEFLKYQRQLGGFNFLAKNTINDLRIEVDKIKKELKLHELEEVPQNLVLATTTNDKGDRFIALKVETPEQAVELCKDSKWCVRHYETAAGRNYLGGNRYLILIRKNGRNYVLLTINQDTRKITEVKDRNNKNTTEEINSEIYPTLKEIFKGNEKELIILKYKFDPKNLGNFDIQELSRLGFSPSEIVDFMILYAKTNPGEEKKFEEYLLKIKELRQGAFNEINKYIREVRPRPWPAFEKILLDTLKLGGSPQFALNYMRYSGKRIRWPEVEEFILKSPSYYQIIEYMRLANIKKRLPEVEDLLFKFAPVREIVDYMEIVEFKGRWEEAEKRRPDLLKSPSYIIAAGSKNFDPEDLFSTLYMTLIAEEILAVFPQAVDESYYEDSIGLTYEFNCQEAFQISVDKICLDDHCYINTEENPEDLGINPNELESTLEEMQISFFQLIDKINERFKASKLLKNIQFPKKPGTSCVTLTEELKREIENSPN